MHNIYFDFGDLLMNTLIIILADAFVRIIFQDSWDEPNGC